MSPRIHWPDPGFFAVVRVERYRTVVVEVCFGDVDAVQLPATIFRIGPVVLFISQSQS